MNTDINTIWLNILRNEDETFKTKTGIPYTYVVENDHILINNDKRRLITKDAIARALLIKNPSPSKIKAEEIWGPSYVYGIITDDRIKNA